MIAPTTPLAGAKRDWPANDDARASYRVDANPTLYAPELERSYRGRFGL